jgi:hypothetical protein
MALDTRIALSELRSLATRCWEEAAEVEKVGDLRSLFIADVLRNLAEAARSSADQLAEVAR